MPTLPRFARSRLSPARGLGRKVDRRSLCMACKGSGLLRILPLLAFRHATELPNGEAAASGEGPAELLLRAAECVAATAAGASTMTREEGTAAAMFS